VHQQWLKWRCNLISLAPNPQVCPTCMELFFKSAVSQGANIQHGELDLVVTKLHSFW
jgi:hypothetical protein